MIFFIVDIIIFLNIWQNKSFINKLYNINKSISYISSRKSMQGQSK